MCVSLAWSRNFYNELKRIEAENYIKDCAKKLPNVLKFVRCVNNAPDDLKPFIQELINEATK